jgi:hypothetical protein
MRLDAVTAEIRPRSDWEAVDLGLAMVRRDFWRCFSVWWLAVLPATVVSGWLLWDAPALWLLVFWWLKPFGSRLVLFEISRRLFGEKPSWRASMREIPKAWVRRFFYRLAWARFSPWLPVTLAVEDLEGLRGKAYRQRCNQVTRRGESVIMWIYFISDAAACWFGFAILVLVGMFIPEGQDGGWQLAVDTWNPDSPMDIPPLILRTVVCCVMASMSLTDLFVTGCGFGVYINNRTWIEGWDVELALKRLARRLTKAAMVILVFGMLTAPTPCTAEDTPPLPAEVTLPPSAEFTQPPPAEVIREVKADEDFKVHTVTERRPRENPAKSRWKWPDWLTFSGDMRWLGQLFVVAAIGLMLGLIVWFVWLNRHAFRVRGGGAGDAVLPARARVVMGMEVSPESLPADVPSAAWMLWKQGRHHEALGLLYRGAISKVMELGRAEIQESDTEGDCVRRVEGAGAAAHPEYFRGITGVWMGQAYAGRIPADDEIEALCRSWPFVERRKP